MRGRHKPSATQRSFEGNVGRSFYVLLHGQIDVLLEQAINVVLNAGSHVGEGALVTEIRRDASVTALKDCYMIQLAAHDCAASRSACRMSRST